MKKEQSLNNALKLLQEYRSALLRKTLLEAVPGMSDKDLDNCVEQVNLTQEIVQDLRNNRLLGEKLYWVIYASYLTERQPIDVDEILDYIAKEYERIPRRTFFRMRGRALQTLEARLTEKSKAR